jgi:hypothetical protein
MMTQQTDSLVLNMRSEAPVPYWPSFHDVAGTTSAAVLLQQIFFRYASTHPEPFYKFKEPCKHKLYRPGDSWIEELHWTAEEFDGALKRIATKSVSGTNKAGLFEKTDPTGLVIYWTTTHRVTYYTVNVGLVDKLCGTVYLKDYASRFTFITENTTEKTQRRAVARPPRTEEPERDLEFPDKNAPYRDPMLPRK